jgi:putative tryptophan/tyrosine transport system substrate-binding protein
MRRRALISFLGGATATWPLAALAQQPALPLIGFLSSRGASDSTVPVTAFRQALSVAGYVEDQNVAIEFRWAEGRYDRLPALAAELVSRPVNVLVAAGGEPSAFAAKAATSTIPIVFSVGGDPVKAGLVSSYGRPGGNITGISLLTTAPESKRLGLLHDLVPKASVIGVLINPSYQEADAQAHELEEGARTLGLRPRILYAKNQEELEVAFATFGQERIDALLVSADPFFDTKRDRIVAFAAQNRLPAIYQFREYAVAGGLMSYGISLPEGYRWVGDYTARLLKGAKPSDLPIVQSIKFEFILNLKTAKALGIEVPPLLLARADEVIE